MKVLIINFNRLTLPRAIADWVSARGCEPIFIDNNSDYPPLMKYYHECPYMVMHMNRNFGHTVVWLPEASILQRLGLLHERYIVTDSDLDLSGVPDDFLAIMDGGLTMYPKYDKCGLSLEIKDLPNYPEGNFIRKHEAKYWNKPLDKNFFHAETDTTFALYREGVTEYSYSAIRCNRPYTARHVPWYYKDFESLSEEDKYYFRSANESSSGKIRLIK